MIGSILGEMMDKAIGSPAQNLETGRSMVDQTFEEVFTSINETVKAKETDRKNRGSIAERPEKEPERDYKPEQTIKRADETNSGKDLQPEKTEDTPRTDESGEIKNTQAEETPIQDVKKAVKTKIKELLDSDPSALKDLLADMKDMSFKDFLSALGFAQDEIEQFSKSVEKLAKELNLSAKAGGEAVKAMALNDLQSFLKAMKQDGGNNKLTEELLAALEKLNGKTGAETETSLTDSIKKIVDLAGSKGKKKNAKGSPEIVTKADPKQVAKTKETAEAIAIQAKNGNPSTKADTGQGTAKATTKQPDISMANDATRKAESSEPTTKPARSSAKSAFERAVLNQVVEKARIHVRADGKSNMTIKLNPPQLGKIDMRVVTHDNMVRAVMIVDTREVKAIIENNLENLRASLNSSGLKVDEISVSTADDSGRFRNENLAQDKRDGSSFKNTGFRNYEDGVAYGDETGGINSMTRIHNGLLDVVA
ncbi:hypothetical protein MNBD_NITROSPINAE01-541 [hydrothermal vent metagenome]|uniref:Flagellar hook-length control protein-like C-terminal domain-containing protein n=1 Tax=hydrothermal vent metagenome TaxID=652676 RepID=A0A3B1CXE4_9ZZZZ